MSEHAALDYFSQQADGLFGNQPETSFPMAFPMLGGGAIGIGGSLVASMMAQQFGIPGGWQGQLFPTINAADFMSKQRWFAGKQQAMQAAASADREQYMQMMRGLARMTNTPFGSEQATAAAALADNMAAIAPIMAQVMPMEFDAIHGSRGSAIVMSDSIYRGGRYSVDPLTGKSGLSGESAGRLAAILKDSYFGSAADVATFKGLSAGQTGMLYEEMAERGLLSRGIGTFQGDVQRRMLLEAPESVEDALKLLRTKDERRFTELVSAAEARSGTSIMSSNRSDAQKIKDVSELKGVTEELSKELQKFSDSPEMEQALLAFDARKIKDRLKGMAGAVAAMRDIFGDAGRPNAPMADLLSALGKMTQDGLSSMSTTEIEQSVRMTYRLAKQSGMGFDAMMGVQGQLGQMADHYGIDRGFAIRAGQDMAAYGGAYKDLGLGAQEEFGKFGIDKSAMLASQLRMRAAASPAANMMAAAYRLRDSGRVTDGSDLSLYLAALDKQQTTFTDTQGRERNVNMQFNDWTAMVSGGSNLSPNEVGMMMQQTVANQEYGLRHDVANKALRIMGVEQSEMILRDAFGDSMSQFLADRGKQLGVDAPQQADMRRFIGSAIGQELLNNQNALDPEKRRQLVADTIRNAGRQFLMQQGASADDADQRMGRLTTAELQQVADMAMGEGSQRLSQRTSYGNLGNFINQHNRTVLERLDSQKRQAQQHVDLQTALSGVGRSGFLQRITDEITSGNDLNTALGKVLGQQSDDAIRTALLPVETALEAVRKDPKGENSRRYEEALQTGGDAARAALQTYADSKDTTIDDLNYETDVIARGLRSASITGGLNIKDSRQRVETWTRGYMSVKDELESLDKLPDTQKNMDRRAELTRRLAAISAGGSQAGQELQRLATTQGLTPADVAKMEKGDFSGIKLSERPVFEALVSASQDNKSVAERLEHMGYYGDAALTAADITEVTQQERKLTERTDTDTDDYAVHLRSTLRRQNSVVDAVSQDAAMWQQLGRERGAQDGVQGLSAVALVTRMQSLQAERERRTRDWLASEGHTDAQKAAVQKYGENTDAAYAADVGGVRGLTSELTTLQEEMQRRMSLAPEKRETLDAAEQATLDKMRIDRSRSLKDAIGNYYTTVTRYDSVSNEQRERMQAIADDPAFKDAPPRFQQEVSRQVTALAAREKLAKSLNYGSVQELQKAIIDNKVDKDDVDKFTELTRDSGELGRLADSGIRNDPEATRDVLIQIRDSLGQRQEEQRIRVEGTVELLDNNQAKLSLSQGGKGSTPVAASGPYNPNPPRNVAAL